MSLKGRSRHETSIPGGIQPLDGIFKKKFACWEMPTWVTEHHPAHLEILRETSKPPRRSSSISVWDLSLTPAICASHFPRNLCK